MIDIKFEDIQQWYQNMLEDKYRDRLSVIKKTYQSFYNLTNQISILYYTILQESEKMQFDSDLPESVKLEQKQALNKIINRSLIILAKMSETKGQPIDKAACQKFSTTFQINLNILCTYYHSLNHCDILRDRLNFQKKKIVQGINKLFALHSKIKDLYRNRHFNELKSISQQKKVISSNIKMIEDNSQSFQGKFQQIDAFQKHLIQFYEGFMQSAEKIQQTSKPIQQIMKVYFSILHQFYQTQAELEISLRALITYCEEIRQRKKGSTSSITDAINIFTRVSTQLLKPNYSIKTMKKLKLDDFSKSLHIIMDQLTGSQSLITFPVENNVGRVENIMQCTNFMMQCIRQLQKVESSGIFTTVQQYKQKVSPSESKKIAHKILQYQKCVMGYYQIQQLINKFQISIGQMTLQQFGIKVNLLVSNVWQGDTRSSSWGQYNIGDMASINKKQKSSTLLAQERI